MTAVAATSARRTARTGVRRDRHEVAYPLLVGVIALVAIGVVMVYSASSVHSYFSTADPSSQGFQQGIWAVFGLLAMVVASRTDFRLLRYVAIPIFVLTMVLLAVVLIPGIGTSAFGSRRWLFLPGLGGFQPAELAKLAVCLYLAHWLDRRGTDVRGLWNGLVPFLVLVGPGFLMIALEPDLGTAGVYVAAGLAVFFMAGANLFYLSAIGASVVGAVYLMVTSTPYQLQRIEGFLDPFRDPLKTGYNAVQALLALGMGGITGAGLGASRLKYLYLPAPSTDFIFAIIGEELGLVGSLLVVILFAAFAVLGVRAAVWAPDRFGSLLAVGITAWIVGQAVLNIGTVIGLLPITGVPLPLVSFGGSSLVITMAAIGVLVNVTRHGRA